METYSRTENVQFVELLEEQFVKMKGGEEGHNGAQAQIVDTREIVYNFRTATQDYKCARKNRISKALALGKTEK